MTPDQKFTTAVRLLAEVCIEANFTRSEISRMVSREINKLHPSIQYEDRRSIPRYAVVVRPRRPRGDCHV